MEAHKEKKVSIHPMCRFKMNLPGFIFLTPSFQYILCVGSSELIDSDVVSAAVFQYILCVGSSENTDNAFFPSSTVSIHPMCRFKEVLYEIDEALQ